MPLFDFSESAMANGDIHPARAIMLDTTETGFRVIEATAGAQCIGISQIAERRSPYESDGLCAKVDEAVKYWGNGAKRVPAQLGGSVTVNDRLKATTAGKLIAITADRDEYCAIAQQSGEDGDIIAVDVVIGQASQA